MKIIYSIQICILIFLNVQAQTFTFNYSLENDSQGWICDFADYPIGDSVTYNLSWRHDSMPVSPLQYGLILSGENFSDDLFFFSKKYISGILPNSVYNVFFEIDAVTKDSYSTIGGSDLVLKAGVTMTEPNKYADTVDSMMRMNILKGNQMGPGPEMDTLGLVRHTFPNNDYYLITLNNLSHPFSFMSGANGDGWLIVGAESMFESFAEFLIAEIRVTFTMASGLDELTHNKLILYPNPSSGKIKLDEEIVRSADYWIYDLTGKILLSGKLNDESVDVSSLSRGVYNLLIKSREKIMAGRFSLIK